MANAVIGAEIRLEGEKDFKRAVSSINTDLKVLGSELQKTESEYKGNENSLSALTAKSEQYNKIAEAQRQKIEILKTAVEKSRTKYTAAGENVEKYRKELSDAQGELDRLKNSEGATTEEVQQQEQAVAELTKKLQTAEKSYSTAEKQTKNWEISLNRAEAELNDTERELGETNKKLREMGESSRFSKEQIEAAERTLSDFGQKAQPIANGFKAAFKTVLAVSAAAAGASAAVIKKSADIGGEFEAQMSKVKAISGATQGEMEQLTAKAKEMGGTTKFTAKQAGEALEYMSMAGWKTADMLNGIEGIMHLAAAAGEDLGRTSDIVTDALTAFGMKAGDAGHFADVLAAASSNANTNVGMMGETFKYVGAAAGALHYSAEDVGLSIGLMANAGIKASQAGTELNSIYTRLAVNTNGARDAIEDLGIKFYTSDGKARAWGTILDALRKKTQNMTDAEKTAFANRVAGQRAQAGLLAMLNATSADYDKLTKSINNADGAAQRMADTMQDNLQGQLTVLKSGLEGTAITIYESMQKPLTEGVKTAVSTLNDPRIQSGVKAVGKQFGDMFAGVARFAAQHAPEFIKGFQRVTAYLSSSSFKSGLKAGGELLMNTGKVAVEIGKVGFPILTKSMELLAKSGKVLVPVLAAGYAGFKALQIVKTTTDLVKGAGAAFQALNVVMMANPWALVIGGAAALAVALVGIAAASSEAEDKYADLREEIDETAESMKQMAKSRQESYDSQYQEIYQVEKLRDRLGELVDKNGKLKGSKEELKSVTDKLNEKSFKVELDKTGTLIKNYKDLKKEIDEYIERKHITAKLDALEPEYNQHQVNIESYTADTLEKKAAYDKSQADFEKKFGIKYGSKEFIDLYENSSLKTQGKEWKEAVKLIEAYGDAWSQAFRKEDEAIKMINAVDEANRLFAAGKYDEANKVLSDYFEERANLFKKASDYEKEQRAQAIDELGNQLLDQMDLYKVATIEKSQGMMDLSLSYVQKTADELKKIGIEIPDGIIEGLKNGTLLVDDAMQQIQEVIKNGGKVDLTEEGKEIDESLSNGLELGIDTVAETGLKVVDSAVKPMGTPTPQAEARKDGQETAGAYADGLELGIDTVAETGLKVVDSAVKPMGAPTPQAEARKDGQETADAYADGVKSKTGAAETAGQNLRDKLLGPLGASESKTEARKDGQDTGKAYADGVEGKKDSAKTAGKDVADASVNGLGSKEADAKAKGTLNAESFRKAIESHKPKANAAGKKTAEAAVSGMKSAESKAGSAGQSIGGAFGSGISSGLSGKISQIKSSAVNAVNKALEAARKAADIHSPSKKASDLVGMPMGEGVGVGFEKGAAKAALKAAASTNAMIEKIRSASAAAAARLSDNGTSGGLGHAGTGGSVNKTINIRYDNTFNGASARDGEAILRQLDRALGAKI